jgi:murein DD-endopeptidase MepM/ murein hydrolase activator NlpD
MLAVAKGLKPGWYLLLALTTFAVVASFGWRSAVVDLREARMELAGRSATLLPTSAVDGLRADAAEGEVAARAAGEASPAAAAPSASAAPPAAAASGPPASAVDLSNDTGLWFPVPGARLPSDDAHLPGAARPYRAGVSEGFVFWPDGAGVPLGFGTPVIAAAAGIVVRADERFAELDATGWEALLVSVADGADDRELDLLRGRQVWIQLDDGRTLRYGHLSGVRPGLSVGQRVGRGRVIGYVGNSGTFDGVAGRTSNARLHFEVRDGDGFVGEGLAPDDVRWLAASLFTGP